MTKTTPKQTTSQIRADIIDAALPDIVFDGWSLSTIENAATKNGYDALTVKAAFPDGITDILDAFADLADQEMLKALAGTNADDLRVRDRIKTALIARFTYLNDHKEAVKESLKFWLNPLRKPRAAKIVWRTADHIWNWAGDTSADYNRYSKRTLLSGIIAPSTLVWLNDHSEDMIKTSDFIDARIANVMTLGKTINKFKSQ
ncbi:MAG: COQ9 family protein [Alphaproteobacteria bacterium]|nr:COQ9 family protein [Alphaproteobacteria bacterium]HCQ71531.1 COQ9 family protein [Rhodospirillaceae bacterium]|tara:strand:- start:5407 stop:6012 length:606 start_codon:yes stop_codon:yes gene_type:complete